MLRSKAVELVLKYFANSTDRNRDAVDAEVLTHLRDVYAELRGRERGEQTPIDTTGPEVLEVRIRADGEVVWVNDAEKCLFRACRIGRLVIDDCRPAEGR